MSSYEHVENHFFELPDGTELELSVCFSIEANECTSMAGNQKVTEKWDTFTVDSIVIIDSPHPDMLGRTFWLDDKSDDELHKQLQQAVYENRFEPTKFDPF